MINIETLKQRQKALGFVKGRTVKMDYMPQDDLNDFVAQTVQIASLEQELVRRKKAIKNPSK